MTINKSQGQTLSKVGLYLPDPIFTHGQLYVAISGVTKKKGLKILILDEDGKVSNTTTTSTNRGFGRGYFYYSTPVSKPRHIKSRPKR